jgi:hypothetical protein
MKYSNLTRHLAGFWLSAAVILTPVAAHAEGRSLDVSVVSSSLSTTYSLGTTDRLYLLNQSTALAVHAQVDRTSYEYQQYFYGPVQGVNVAQDVDLGVVHQEKTWGVAAFAGLRRADVTLHPQDIFNQYQGVIWDKKLQVAAGKTFADVWKVTGGGIYLVDQHLYALSAAAGRSLPHGFSVGAEYNRATETGINLTSYGPILSYTLPSHTWEITAHGGHIADPAKSSVFWGLSLGHAF